MGRRSSIKSVSVNNELVEWADERGIKYSTYLNALLYLLRYADVGRRTRNLEEAKRDIIVAALRAIGLEVNEEDVVNMLSKRLCVEVRACDRS